MNTLRCYEHIHAFSVANARFEFQNAFTPRVFGSKHLRIIAQIAGTLFCVTYPYTQLVIPRSYIRQRPVHI